MNAVQRIGKYQIVRELGSGAMGVVYEGYDPVARRKVAIKTLLDEHVAERGSESALTRFWREAQTGERLHHPGIVAVHEYGEDGHTAFIVMELVNGQELRRLLRQRGRLAWGETLFIMQQLLDALDHSHRRGVIHRDIKPANVMVMEGLLIKVMDFGIARIQSSLLTQVGTLLGTPTHMAPEQLAGEVADERCDLWAAGVMLYEMLAGQTPFAGKTSAAVMGNVMQLEPTPLTTLLPNVPVGVDSVLARALAKRPDRRFQSAPEFLRALDVAAMSGPAAAGGLDLDLAPATDLALDLDATVIGAPAGQPAARPAAAFTAPAPPAREVPAVAPAPAANARFDAETLARAERRLADYIGQQAPALTRLAAADAQNLADLYRRLALHIEPGPRRRVFLNGSA